MQNLNLAKPTLFVIPLALSLSAISQAQPLTGKPDSQMAAVLQSLKELKPKPIEKLNYKQARQQPLPVDAVLRLLKKQGKSTAPEKVDSVVDKFVPGPAGKVRVRVYRPLGSGSKKLPVLAYFHGGGFVIASVAAYDSSARALANAANTMVVSVDYRMAPEHKLPAAHEDSYAVTQWLFKNVQGWNGDPKRIAVGGESAGGNLATDVCIMAKMRGGKMPIHQLLVYPLVSGKNTQSKVEQYNAKPLNTPMIKWFVKYAVPKSLMKSPLVAPNDAPDSVVEGLPSATIVLAELDPLRSEGQAYANKLRRNGIKTNLRLYPGVTHEFFGMGAVVNKSKAAVAFAAADLKQAFAK